MNHYRRLSEEQKYFVTRVKSNMGYQVLAELDSTEAGIGEQLVYIGTLEHGNRQLLRLVTVPFEGESYQYLTNLLDQARLSGREIAELYRQRCFQNGQTAVGVSLFSREQFQCGRFASLDDLDFILCGD